MIHQDPSDENAIVVNGFEQGVADNPYKGISDMRNVNLISIPGEASVLFATSKISFSNANGIVTAADPTGNTITISGPNLNTGQTIIFSAVTVGGLAINTTYWVLGGSNPYKLYSDPNMTTLVDITSDGTGTYTTIDMGLPTYFNYYSTPFLSCYFMVDNNGLVWSNLLGLIGGYWSYMGNTTTGTNGSARGNGLVSYIPSNVGSAGIGYLFVFRDFQIDYATLTGNTISWTYGWNPATGTANNNNYLKCALTYGSGSPNLIHEAIVGPDNKVYYCDANWIGNFYQTNSTTPFNPTDIDNTGDKSGTSSQTSVLPFTDSCQCMTFLGDNLLIGGTKNIIYPWDTFSYLPKYPLFVAENNIQKLITINTNAYALVGNRGRIYITNGSQAQLYKKVPDHISGTVEPYYTWGGIASNKNQLYFGCYATQNNGSALVNNSTIGYGGLWAIDVDTEALRMVNQLSYGTYSGYASAIIANQGTTPAGTGLYIGWSNGTTYGIDTTISTPYTGTQPYVDTEIIPIGTFYRQKVFKTVEYKLSAPMVSGESVSIYYRLNFHDAFTLIWTDTATASHLPFSGNSPVNFDNSQWVQLRIVLKSVASNPSYVRLTELRIK